MEVPVRNLAGETVGAIELDARVFGVDPNRAVLHQAVVAHLANARAGSASTRTRAEVAGGGPKPWRQKGTGRARHGSIRGPGWRGGGVVFGPRPRSYHQHLPRKMRALALRSALSDKMASGGLIVVDRFSLDEPRTKALISTLRALGVDGKAIIVLSERDVAVRKAAGNLPDVHIALPNGVALLDVLRADTVILSRDAVEPVTALLIQSAARAPAAA